jgi:hypothetical protein
MKVCRMPILDDSQKMNSWSKLFLFFMRHIPDRYIRGGGLTDVVSGQTV